MPLPKPADNQTFTEQSRADKETLDVLAGRRRAETRQAAVRIEDLIGILQLPPTLQATSAAAAPTQAEFEALRRDVAKLHAQLMVVSSALQRRLTP
jgi:hypothetical protein